MTKDHPHTPRVWRVDGKDGEYCLNDGQVWPCLTARRKVPGTTEHLTLKSGGKAEVSGN